MLEKTDIASLSQDMQPVLLWKRLLMGFERSLKKRMLSFFLERVAETVSQCGPRCTRYTSHLLLE